MPAFPAALQAHLRMVRTVLQRSRPHARPARVGHHRRSWPRQPARRCRDRYPCRSAPWRDRHAPGCHYRPPSLTARSRAPAFDRQLWSRPVSRRAIPTPASRPGFLHGLCTHATRFPPVHQLGRRTQVRSCRTAGRLLAPCPRWALLSRLRRFQQAPAERSRKGASRTLRIGRRKGS